MASKKPVVKPASERVKKFVAESSIPGSDAHRLDEAEAELQAEGTQLTVLNLRVNAIEKRMAKLREEITQLCPHTTQEQSSHYFSGSYDEVARTFYTLKCKRCGKTMKSWDKAHGYYG